MVAAEDVVPVLRSPARRVPAWVAAAVFGALTLLILLSHLETLIAMARTWIGNGAYAHGWLVPGLSAALVWQRRATLAAVPRRPHWSGVLALGLGAWTVTLAEAASIQLVAQLALIAMIPAAALASFGPAVLRVLVAPAAFLLFMVPFGDELVPALTKLTAAATVAGVQLMGVPVYQDGLYFSIPAGDFEVAKACSGLRYLIASITLSLFYALAFLRNRRLQLAFVALGIVVPLVANLVRAFLIVMLAHWSDMRIATGVDHIIYGWIFFGVVMLALFMLGERLRRRETAKSAGDVAPVDLGDGPAKREASLAAAFSHALASAVAVLAVPALVASRFADANPPAVCEDILPAQIREWRAVSSEGEWRPRFSGATRILERTYLSGRDGAQVSVVVLQYVHQSQGAELINWDNAVYDRGEWQATEQGRHRPFLDDRFRVSETRLRASGRSRLVWSWYAVGDRESASGARMQLHRLWLRARGRAALEGAIVISTSFVEENGASRETLARLTAALRPELHRCFAS